MIDIAKASNPLWRLSNLYEVKKATDGEVIPFRPRPEQMELFRRHYRDGFRREIVLKARRLGMSTALDLMLVDQILWNQGRQVTIVDQTSSDAERKLELIIRPAVNSLMNKMPGWKIIADNKGEYTIQAPDCKPSYLFAGVRARGGTNHLLHISEWGVIQADDPRRSAEILTGAVPSAEHGSIWVETTWKGGRGGDLYELVKEAQEMPEEYKGAADWRVMFFPWWVDRSYVSDGSIEGVSPDVLEYLAEKEIELGKAGQVNPLTGTAFEFTDAQKVWYAAKKREQKAYMWREFPTSIEECFKAPIEGAIYAEFIDKSRAKGRILDYEPAKNTLVHTAWDIGAPINTVTWFFQVYGTEVRIIDVMMDDPCTPTERVAKILAKGYNLGNHLLPHDAAGQQNSGTTFQQDLERLGLANTRIVTRCNDVWDRINMAQEDWEQYVFHKTNTETGLDALSQYHFLRESSTGLIKDVPVHNWASHPADAFGTIAQGMREGLVLATPAERATRRSRPTVRKATKVTGRRRRK